LVIWNCSKYAPTYFGRQIAILRKKRIKPSVLSKGKAIPLQAWTGPEGFRRLRLSDFKTICT